VFQYAPPKDPKNDGNRPSDKAFQDCYPDNARPRAIAYGNVLLDAMVGAKLRIAWHNCCSLAKREFLASECSTRRIDELIEDRSRCL
jgi:hypothetical protein